MRNIAETADKHLRKFIRGALRRFQEIRFAPGSLIAGRYRVVRRLGMGSYGVAYLCIAVGSGELCVLKRVYPLNGGSARTERVFTRETEIMQRLDHAAIPKLSERFHFRGQPCLVMEYIPGDTLDELLFRDHRRFSEQESLRIFLSLLDIVDYLHSRRIIHRDISIGNVMLQEDEGRIHLIDFGLAVGLDDRDPVVSTQAADVNRNDPMEKKLSRAVHVTSDFYAMGHLLLFLLYSTFQSDEDKEKPCSSLEQGWENELKLHPLTHSLLRRLLQADKPFAEVKEARALTRSILEQPGMNMQS
jgi:serine/threonine protein kinase, bacterial